MKTKTNKKPVQSRYAIFLIVLLGTAFLSFSLYDLNLQMGRTTHAEENQEQEDTEDNNVSVLTSKMEKLSYALGMDFGNRLRSESIVVDADIFSQGLEDALSGATTQMSEEELRKILLEMRNELKQRKQAASLTKPSWESSDIHVSFKLDPRLTRGMYMGTRWVSPQVYTRVGEEGEKEVAVEAKARVLDKKGRELRGDLAWETSDPEMIIITHDQGDTVNITVKRPGQGSLKLTSAGIAKQLSVKATDKDGTLQVEISQ